MKIVPLSYPILLNAQKKLSFEQEDRLRELFKKLVHQKKAKAFINRGRS